MDRKNRQTIRRSGAFVLAAGLSLTWFGVGTASADELAPTDEARVLADKGGVPNGGNAGGGGQGGGQDNPGGGQGGGNPTGNNGTVKVHGSQGDESTQNEPKVDCLNLAWYDYADAAQASVVVTMVGGPDSPTVGQAATTLVADPADGGGYDGELAVPLDFTGIDPANNGMYHVRVDVTTASSTGQSQQKSKVVWVSGSCGGGTTTTPPGGCVPSATVTCGGLFDLDPVVTAAPVVETPAAPAGQPTDVLGNQVVDTPAAAPAAAAPVVDVKGAELARTGALTDRLVQVAGALLVLGGIAMLASKERAVVAPTRRR